jgi:hypothetical protein
MERKVRSDGVRTGAFDVPTIEREIEYIVGRATHRESRVVTLGPLIFFSTGTGDAWMLDPSDGRATCLLRDGTRGSVGLDDCGAQVGIDWAGSYRIEGDAFTYVDPAGRVLTVLGYPTREIGAAATKLLQ